MLEERNEIKNFTLYSDDKNHRYLLTRIWDEKKPIPLFVSKCSGEADGIYLELTNTLITNNLYELGYGGYYAVNLCSGIHGKTRSLKDNETDNIILKYAKKSSEIIISWGTLNTLVLKERETEVLKLLKSAKKKVLAVSDNNGRTNLHILTPCVRSGFVLNEVNLKEILAEGLKKTEKTEKSNNQSDN